MKDFVHSLILDCIYKITNKLQKDNVHRIESTHTESVLKQIHHDRAYKSIVVTHRSMKATEYAKIVPKTLLCTILYTGTYNV